MMHANQHADCIWFKEMTFLFRCKLLTQQLFLWYSKCGIQRIFKSN